MGKKLVIFIALARVTLDAYIMRLSVTQHNIVLLSLSI